MDQHLQQQLIDSMYPTATDSVTAGEPVYAQPAQPKSYFTDPTTGKLTGLSIAIILALLFAVVASPPVFQFVGKSLASTFSGSQWISASGAVSTKLLIVHTLVFGFLSFILLKFLARETDS